MPVPSPCSLVCVLDPFTGWCLGCGRTVDEIAAWGGLDDAARLLVRNALPSRMVTLRDRPQAESNPEGG